MIPLKDYQVYLQEKRLSMIIEDDSALVESAEATAMQIVDDHLYPYYDTEEIFSNIDDHLSVKRWIMIIVIYLIYERIPDALVPNRVVKNYDDTLGMLFKISDGKGVVNLPRLKHDVDGKEITNTKFRWGSEERRTQS